MKHFLLLSFICLSIVTAAQPKYQSEIHKILNAQVSAWNQGDIAGFMQGYWQSDSLLFIGKSGPTNGWQKTFNNYKKNYPDTIIMGKLSFDVLEIKKLSDQYCFVVGKWSLNRSMGNVGGYFTLIFRKFKNGWKIVADHSS